MRASRRSHGPDRDVSGSAKTCTLVAAKPGGSVKVGTGVGLLARADDDTGRGVADRTGPDRRAIVGWGLTGRVILGSGDAGPLGAGVGVFEGVGDGESEGDGEGEGEADGDGEFEGVGVGLDDGDGDGEGDGSSGVSMGGSAMLCTLGPELFVDRLGAEVRTGASASDGSAESAALCALVVESLELSLHVEVVVAVEASGVGVDEGCDAAKDVRAGTDTPIAVTPMAVTDATTRRSARCIRVPLSAPGSLTPAILPRNPGRAPPGHRADCRQPAGSDVIRGVRAPSDLRECP